MARVRVPLYVDKSYKKDSPKGDIRSISEDSSIHYRPWLAPSSHPLEYSITLLARINKVPLFGLFNCQVNVSPCNQRGALASAQFLWEFPPTSAFLFFFSCTYYLLSPNCFSLVYFVKYFHHQHWFLILSIPNVSKVLRWLWLARHPWLGTQIERPFHPFFLNCNEIPGPQGHSYTWRA